MRLLTTILLVAFSLSACAPVTSEPVSETRAPSIQASGGTFSTSAGGVRTAIIVDINIPRIDSAQGVDLTVVGPERWNDGRLEVLDGFVRPGEDPVVRTNWFATLIDAVDGQYTISFERDGETYKGSFTVDSTSRLPRPTGIDVGAASGTSVEVSWSPVAGAEFYIVTLYEVAGGNRETSVIGLGTAEPEITLMGFDVSPGSYIVKVHAYSTPLASPDLGIPFNILEGESDQFSIPN